MFTFVIPARDEQDSVATIVGQACQAAQPGDRVLVVDSASTDATGQRAAAAGAEVLRGPPGKGAAMAHAIAEVSTPWVCFLDADLISADLNVPATLRQAAVSGDADHVLGDYEYADPATILASTFTIYEPLVTEFFPEVGVLGANSLTGYRAIRRSYLDRPLPLDFGVESYLNISIATAGGTAAVSHLGVIASRFKYKPDMCREIARSILDLAIAHGRLHTNDRPRWNTWVDDGIPAILAVDGTNGRSATLARLFAAVRRPMPPRACNHPAAHLIGSAPSGSTVTMNEMSTRRQDCSDSSCHREPSAPYYAAGAVD
jgi:glucosyl-3-phosphoglycerate synthase